MGEPPAIHQSFEYREDEPFLIYNVTPRSARESGRFIYLEHWHEELELAYVLEGYSRHYIDGACVQAEPGRLIVTNSEFVHRIAPDLDMPSPGQIATIVLLIHRQFIRDNFPQYQDIYFTNEKRQARPEIKTIMLQLSDYAQVQEHTPFDVLYVRGLLLQLLYHMCQEGTVSRELTVARLDGKKRQRFKEILQYITDHYREPLPQSEVAAQFYFSKGYFSRYFKQNTGATYSEYLTQYRVRQAHMDLLRTDMSVLEIALHNGFADERRFIQAFKKFYQTTPHQYRKRQSN